MLDYATDFRLIWHLLNGAWVILAQVLLLCLPAEKEMDPQLIQLWDLNYKTLIKEVVLWKNHNVTI